MAKFELKFKLTGLEIEVKGERGDMPLIANNMAKQIGDMLKPAANIVEGAQPQISGAIEASSVEPAPPRLRKKRGAVRVARAAVSSTAASEPRKNFVVDIASWGKPLQTWSQADKATWLLYVAAQSGFAKEMIGSEISSVFNEHYRQSGMIRPQNVNRDLGNYKDGVEALVGRTEALAWFLKDAGTKHAEKLVIEARGKAAS
jgi:hypothetical protein